MKLVDSYDNLVLSNQLVDNLPQRQIIQTLDSYFNTWFIPRCPLIYMWGTVGSGKTLCMDLVYKSYKGPKERFHYSDWVAKASVLIMSKIGRHYTWEDYVNETFKKGSLVCIDEWAIEDITQAIIWQTLIPLFMKNKIYVLLTTNVAPNDIYKDGLGRNHILDLIDLVSKKALILNLSQTFDFRKKGHLAAGTFKRVHFLHEISKVVSSSKLEERQLPLKSSNKDIIWLDFLSAITPPMWRHDYMKWSQDFEYIFIEGVTEIANNKNLIANWTRLVDVLYDQNKCVFMTYKGNLSHILEQRKIPKRTISRMQSWIFHQEKFYDHYINQK
jgi:cell division protein ZapE